MKAAVPWLATLLCAGWIASPASAFHILRDLRNRNNGEVTVTDQTPATPVSDAANCDTTGGHHHLLPGYLHSIPGHFHSCLEKAKGCLQNVPGRAPPPPKPLVINPYLRSPRDFFMLDDP